MKKIVISEEKLNAIISEGVKKAQRKLALESEKKKLTKRLNEIALEEAELDEFFGGGAFKKALNDYKATHKDDIAKLQQAFKTYSDDYVTISQNLAKNAMGEAKLLAKKYGVDPADFMVVYKDIMATIQPMDFSTFKAQQKKGGWSMTDLGGREQTTGA